MKEVIIKSKIVGKEGAIGSGKPIAFPDLSAYALRSDFIRLESSFNDFLNGDDTDNVINRWKELEAFLNNISEDYNLLSLLNGKADKATTLSGYGITDAYTKTNVDDLLKAYVTLSGSQTITGEKNFVGGLKVNGSPIYYDSTKKYWKLEGDLLVTGGVTMYGNEGTYTPSTIMDALLYDDATLGINSNGQLYVKGGAGGGINTTDLQNYLTQNSYLNVTSGDNRYLKLSGGKITGLLSIKGEYVSLYSSTNDTNASSPKLWLGAYDYGGGFYTGSYIQAINSGGYGNHTISFFTKNSSDYTTEPSERVRIRHDGSVLINTLTYNGYTLDVNGTLNATTIYQNGTTLANTYLPLSGGTITGELFVSSTSNNRAQISLISAADVPNDLVFGTNGEYHWSITSRDSVEGRYIGLYNNKVGSNGWVYKVDFDNRVLDFMNTPTVNGGTIWHAGNDGSGSTLNADLLDGYHAVDFTKTINSSVDDFLKFTNKARFQAAYLQGQGDFCSLVIPTWSSNREDNWYLSELRFAIGGNPKFRMSHNGTVTSDWKEIAFTDSNVASATKLQTTRTIWGQSFDGTGNVDGDIYINGLNVLNTSSSELQIGAGTLTTHVTALYGTEIKLYSGGTKFYSLIFNSSGNVGLGTPTPSDKLDVNGVIRANGAKIYNSDAGVISLYRTVTDGGSYVDYYPSNQTSQKWRVGAGSVDEFFYEAADGSNLARICHHATRGTRLEVGKSFLSVQPSGSDADRSVITLISNGDSPTDFIMGSGNYAWSITSRNSAEGHLLGFYSALSGQYAMRVYKEGNVLVTGGITMYSDKRKKTILNHVELSLKQIAEAPLIEHYYNSDEKKTTHVGSIAQYWANMNDWFCKLDSEGYYTMEIQNAALASAISIARELDRYETKTDKDIKKLKKRICELEEEIERLRAS